MLHSPCLTCSDWLQIFWGRVGGTLVMSPSVFFMGPRQIANVTSEIWKFLFFENEPQQHWKFYLEWILHLKWGRRSFCLDNFFSECSLRRCEAAFENAHVYFVDASKNWNRNSFPSDTNLHLFLHLLSKIWNSNCFSVDKKEHFTQDFAIKSI